MPNIDTLYRISAYYRVTVDWLVGLSPVKDIVQASEETRNICDALDLSQTAVRGLQSIKGTKVGRGIDTLLSMHCINKDHNVESLLDAIGKFIADAFDHSTNDAELKINKEGLLSIETLGKTEGKHAEIQTPLAYSAATFTLTDLLLEKQIRDIDIWLRFYKDRCTRIKNFNNRRKEFADETNT